MLKHIILFREFATLWAETKRKSSNIKLSWGPVHERAIAADYE